MLRMAFTLYSSPPESGGVRGGLNEQRDNPLFRPPLTPPNLGGERNIKFKKVELN